MGGSRFRYKWTKGRCRSRDVCLGSLSVYGLFVSDLLVTPSGPRPLFELFVCDARRRRMTENTNFTVYEINLIEEVGLVVLLRYSSQIIVGVQCLLL